MCPHLHTQSTPFCTAAWGPCGWCLLPTPRHNSALFRLLSISFFLSLSVSHTATSPQRKSCLIPQGSPTSPQSRAPQPAWPTPCSRSWPAHTAGAHTAPAPCSAQRVSDCPLPPTALKPKVGQTLPPPRSREWARGRQHDPLHHHHHHHKAFISGLGRHWDHGAHKSRFTCCCSLLIYNLGHVTFFSPVLFLHS